MWVDTFLILLSSLALAVEIYVVGNYCVTLASFNYDLDDEGCPIPPPKTLDYNYFCSSFLTADGGY